MIYLGLGSNLGDREDLLSKAVKLLDEHQAIIVKRVSSIYETAPVGITDQPAFLNAVVAVETSLSVYELLTECLWIEAVLGRVRTVRWGPRTIDIDLLLYNELKLDSEALIIPHPRMHVRPFVLIPLSELIGEQKIINGMTANELLETCDVSGVRFYKEFDWRNSQ